MDMHNRMKHYCINDASVIVPIYTIVYHIDNHHKSSFQISVSELGEKKKTNQKTVQTEDKRECWVFLNGTYTKSGLVGNF